MAEIVALVSLSPVFVIRICQEVELSSASCNVLRDSSVFNLTPGALMITVCVSILFSSLDSSTKLFGSIWNDKSTRPSVVGVQFHSTCTDSPGVIEIIWVEIRLPSARAMTSNSGAEPAPMFSTVTPI